MDETSDELWQLVEYSMTEALILRSFLEYLRVSPISLAKKQEKIARWKAHVGSKFGDPKLVEQSHQVTQRLRDAPPEMRNILLQELLNAAYSKYFDFDSDALNP